MRVRPIGPDERGDPSGQPGSAQAAMRVRPIGPDEAEIVALKTSIDTLPQ